MVCSIVEDAWRGDPKAPTSSDWIGLCPKLRDLTQGPRLEHDNTPSDSAGLSSGGAGSRTFRHNQASRGLARLSVGFDLIASDRV